ncbi:MAG: UbiX family flavin prenyltransferase [Chloroflexi bacterium]|nr:MAG: UbiX family flavin prenyltransferase [Chloroflexota bacterium]TMB77536.1 MAG: UbiX family flavin prenyltransferase [Chloroflexota bacterium]TMB93365.1 MAG: UbiX family flavin prenyltransferase [Chloroflexota bacterium]TMC28394.1 MAG: UbiX family flavin prenyltransferase [Chloroflexota bacterium]TMC37383.1 MAG: UbiX family flavin prenyltransferase [Chloroflexota bacterium]
MARRSDPCPALVLFGSGPPNDREADVSLPRRIVVAISGASGAIYGVRAVETIREDRSVELHLIISAGAKATIEYETDRSVADVAKLADVVHEEKDLAATIASGSFQTHGMLVAPCSIRTLSAIAIALNDNLIVRAADVHLKERRKLVLMVRETPLNATHLRLMHEATLAGAVILPPVPGFYQRPKTLMDLVDHSVGKALDQLGIEHSLFERWSGIRPSSTRAE